MMLDLSTVVGRVEKVLLVGQTGVGKGDFALGSLGRVLDARVGGLQ
ncbi:hypothetical protein PPSIR1_21284 [Plesiocystis pacifica SIR-1]|uniref:Uncharacterized protein n=1 Tax=Plesiocystis pacifica SIR-1 TaxID=391625 RepID=A6G3J6_9BACT|nr:hypothetical protein PPSIR1_21284 [Plesiocystis pacifica SIR-1]